MAIRELNAPKDLGIQPSDRAMEATAGAGRRIAGLYGQAAEAEASTGRSIASGGMALGEEVLKQVTHREISQGAATAATLFSGLDADWNAKIKDPNFDPNDASAKAEWTEKTLEPRLQKLRDAFVTEGGEKFAEAQIEQFRNHFNTKTSADMATMAGIAVRSNINTLTNQLSNMAINDPTSVKASLGMIEHSIGAMVDSSPTLTGVAAAKVKEELLGASQAAIVKAAAIGAINANPEAGLKEFSSEKYSKYISGADVKQLEQQAKSVKRAERADDENRLKIQKMEKEDASDRREGEYLEKLHSGDPKQMGEVSAKAIASDWTLTRSARERMIGIVERETKPETVAKVSNATAVDLISRIRAPDGDPMRITDLNPVYDAYEKGLLSKSDLKFVRDEFTNISSPDGKPLGREQDTFIKSVKPLIDKSNPLLAKIDPSGAQNVYEFTIALQRKTAEYRKAGKDPRDLMDPSKPDYMGSPAALVPYQKTLQQSLQDTAAAMRRGSGSGFPAADTITGISVEPKPVATSTPRPAAAKPPEKGFIKDGYEFMGGNPGEATSWRRVGS